MSSDGLEVSFTNGGMLSIGDTKKVPLNKFRLPPVIGYLEIFIPPNQQSGKGVSLLIAVIDPDLQEKLCCVTQWGQGR